MTNAKATETMDPVSVEHYLNATYRLTAMVAKVEQPERKVYEFTRNELDEYLDSQSDYGGEYVVELIIIG